MLENVNIKWRRPMPGKIVTVGTARALSRVGYPMTRWEVQIGKLHINWNLPVDDWPREATKAEMRSNAMKQWGFVPKHWDREDEADVLEDISDNEYADGAKAEGFA